MYIRSYCNLKTSNCRLLQIKYYTVIVFTDCGLFIFYNFLIKLLNESSIIGISYGGEPQGHRTASYHSIPSCTFNLIALKFSTGLRVCPLPIGLSSYYYVNFFTHCLCITNLTMQKLVNYNGLEV